MNLMFWKSPKPRVVTQAINRHLNSEFGMGSELLAKLRMLEKNGKFSDRKVRMVRVFDPELVSASAGSKLKFDLKGASKRTGRSSCLTGGQGWPAQPPRPSRPIPS